MIRRYLFHCPSEVDRVCRLLGPGHGPVHLLVESASEVGFRWDSGVFGWARPGLFVFCNLAGPFQHFKTANLNAWRDKVAADLGAREGFREGARCLTLLVPCNSLTLAMFGKEIRRCLEVFW